MTEFNMAARDSIIPEGYTYSELRPLIETTLRSGISVLLRGHPGVGKSSLAQELATAMNLELIDIRLAQRDPAELCGVYFPDHERQALELFAPAWVKQAVEKPCLVFLDEINAAVTKLHQAAAYQIVLEHRVGQFRFHPETVVMGAGNLEEDNAIVASLSSALCNRFAHFILRPEVSDWLSWGVRHGIDGAILAYIGAHDVDVLYKNNGEFAFPTPRSWEMASRVFARAADGDRKRAVAACIGPSAADRFFTYYKIYGQFDVEGVVNRGQKISFDSRDNSEPSYIFAAVFAVSGYVCNLESLTPEQVTNTVGFIDSNGLDPEHRFLFLQQLKRRSDLFDLFRPNRHFQRLAANLVDFRSVRVSKPEEPDILEKCLAVVRQNGLAIEHLTDTQRTPEVCLAAVRQNGYAIHHLKDAQRTPAVCLAAVLENGEAITYLTDTQPMPEIFLAAVQNNVEAIHHLKDAQRTPKVCLAAVRQDGKAIEYLTNTQRTPEVCLAAVRRDGKAIEYLTDAQRTPEVCLAAVKQNGHAIYYLSDIQRTPKVCYHACRQMQLHEEKIKLIEEIRSQAQKHTYDEADPDDNFVDIALVINEI